MRICVILRCLHRASCFVSLFISQQLMHAFFFLQVTTLCLIVLKISWQNIEPLNPAKL